MTALQLWVLAGCASPRTAKHAPGAPVDAAVPTCGTSLADSLEPLGVPGLSGAIVVDGRLVCTTVAGDANREESRPVTPDTLFAWASVSKTVTGTALMTLFDDGRFALDDDIAPFLPFAIRVPGCDGDPITFRELLTHTSSITDFHREYNDSYGLGDSPIALDDFLRGYFVPGGEYYDRDQNFASLCPGTVYHYSNIGAGLIGYLVEEISGTPFETFCQERLFGPLGMDESSFRLADLDPDHIAMPYDGHDEATFDPIGHIGFPTYPDGLLRTSVPQMARFLGMFEERGELDGVTVLDRSTAEEMRTDQFPAFLVGQGLIWYRDSFPGHKHLLGHEGDDPGTSSLMYFDPDTERGALLVANGFWNADRAQGLEAKAVLGRLMDEADTW